MNEVAVIIMNAARNCTATRMFLVLIPAGDRAKLPLTVMPHDADVRKSAVYRFETIPARTAAAAP